MLEGVLDADALAHAGRPLGVALSLRRWASFSRGPVPQKALDTGQAEAPRSGARDVPTTPRVSVIVPSYNVEPFLADAVRSVLRQSWTDLELLIVNDGSTDGTPGLAARFETEDRRVRVVHKQNGGLSSARNAGISAARGEFICFLDADDAILPSKLEKQVAFLDFFRNCGLVFSDHYLGDAHLNPITFENKRPPNLPMRDLLTYTNWFAPFSPLIRAGFVAKVGSFDEDLKSAEDWDYWVRASRSGTLAYLPGPVGVYRTHPVQMSKNHQRMRANQDKVIRKNFEQGSSEWRNVQAARAWSEAKIAWANRRRLRMATMILRSAWRARSWSRMKKVMALAG